MTQTLCLRPRWIWLSLLGFCGMLSAAGAGASAGTITDDAHIFSSSAVAQVQQIIDQIRIRHSKDLNVETIASVPADQRGALEAQGKDAFFEQWARERAKAMGTNGVYVLICMEPRHLQVEVGNKTLTREFTRADREALRIRLISQFKAQQYDAGIIDAANFVLERMDANTRQAGLPANQGTGAGQAPPPTAVVAAEAGALIWVVGSAWASPCFFSSCFSSAAAAGRADMAQTIRSTRADKWDGEAVAAAGLARPAGRHPWRRPGKLGIRSLRSRRRSR